MIYKFQVLTHSIKAAGFYNAGCSQTRCTKL